MNVKQRSGKVNEALLFEKVYFYDFFEIRLLRLLNLFPNFFSGSRKNDNLNHTAVLVSSKTDFGLDGLEEKGVLVFGKKFKSGLASSLAEKPVVFFGDGYEKFWSNLILADKVIV